MPDKKITLRTILEEIIADEALDRDIRDKALGQIAKLNRDEARKKQSKIWSGQ